MSASHISGLANIRRASYQTLAGETQLLRHELLGFDCFAARVRGLAQSETWEGKYLLFSVLIEGGRRPHLHSTPFCVLENAPAANT